MFVCGRGGCCRSRVLGVHCKAESKQAVKPCAVPSAAKRNHDACKTSSLASNEPSRARQLRRACSLSMRSPNRVAARRKDTRSSCSLRRAADVLEGSSGSTTSTVLGAGGALATGGAATGSAAAWGAAGRAARGEGHLPLC